MAEIAILGGGALGLLLAGKLAEAGSPAVVWTHTEDQALRIGEEGIAIEEPLYGVKRVVKVDALPVMDVPAGFTGTVLLTVKQTAVKAPLLDFLRRTVAHEGAVTMFQNGLGHVEPIAEALPGRHLLAAVTTEGALRIGPASVRHTGQGETWLGQAPVGGVRSGLQHARMQQFVRVLKQAGFTVSVSNDIRERMVRKLLINAVINPLTALWRVTNGELPATPERIAVMQTLYRETALILRTYGLRGTETPELWESVLAVCSSTAGNRSSMLQDVLAGRETEIDALNGAVCRIADSVGICAPWNAAVTALVKAIQSTEEREA